MPITFSLETPTVQIARGHSIRIDGDTNGTFYNDLNESEVMRSIQIGRFEVRFIAETMPALHLDYLVTKASIVCGKLHIEESARYTQSDVMKHGSQQVIKWINRDREHMAEIIRSYVGLSDDPAVFNARVQVVHKDSEAVLGERTLGQCIYDSHEDFCQGGGYASDLVSQAISEARDAIHDLLAPPSQKVV